MGQPPDLETQAEERRRRSVDETSVASVTPTPLTMAFSNAERDGDARSMESGGGKDVESSLAAWGCVMGSGLFLVASFGFMQSLGTVQSYLSLNQLKSYSSGEVGWIIGVYMFLALLLNIQVGPVFDRYGPRVLSVAATVLCTAMFLLMAECRAYWHFMLCFGVFGSLGAALNMVVAVAVVAKLFVRKRGLAMGIALAGSSVGNVCFPIMLRSTYPRLGWAWSMRLMALVTLVAMVVGSLCFIPFPRLVAATPGRQQKSGSAGLSLVAFRSWAFNLVTTGLFMFEYTIFGITGLIPSIATGAGFTPEGGYTLIAILGATSFFGRILAGVGGDRVGHFNILLGSLVVTVVAMGTMFVPFGTTSAPVLYAFCAVWGFTSGSFLSVTPVCMGKTCDAKDYGRYYGTMNFVLSFSLLISIPLNGTMLDSMGAQALAGLFMAVVFLGGFCYFAARALLVGSWFDFKTVM